MVDFVKGSAYNLFIFDRGDNRTLKRTMTFLEDGEIFYKFFNEIRKIPEMIRIDDITRAEPITAEQVQEEIKKAAAR